MKPDINQPDKLLQGLGFTPEHWIEAQQLVATHGHRAQQHVVDLMQAALRAKDEETARSYDALLKLINLRDRFLSEPQAPPQQKPGFRVHRSCACHQATRLWHERYARAGPPQPAIFRPCCRPSASARTTRKMGVPPR